MFEELAGWIGGVVMLVAYVLVSTRRTPSDGTAYQAMNVVGGLLLTVSAYHAGAFPNVGLNVFWIAAGVLTIAWNLRRRVRDAETVRESDLAAAVESWAAPVEPVEPTEPAEPAMR
ncbi:hypothetical protein KLP28_07445 [Nocardioidaceae bacterium]|nr:hypothetical protein KLP28_07445 [Nocardioidaceae bacterium]